NQPGELFSQLKAYANMANAAYLSEPEARTIIEAQGYQLDQFSSVPGVEVNYFIATSDTLKRHIIAVRGTANIENAIVDISLKLLPDQHTGIALHQGFAQAAEGVYMAVQPKLNRDYEISTTGHSLGGAVAVILAMYLDKDNFNLGPIMTFGQPKVTNVRGALAFQRLDIHRAVTAQDLVPLVPPLDAMDIRNLDIYWHLGEEVVLLDGNDYAMLTGVKSMMRATRIINAELSQQNLEHHKMAVYLKLIDDKSQAANLVPYATGIDLLKLFSR
ncbi:MAG TPA: lipase family protein, partial [Candidatus Tenderia electrophaga]|nr:lipase family protein [Candidatus Tenderia electrophaga]